jgi:hypothetical protein
MAGREIPKLCFHSGDNHRHTETKQYKKQAHVHEEVYYSTARDAQGTQQRSTGNTTLGCGPGGSQMGEDKRFSRRRGMGGGGGLHCLGTSRSSSTPATPAPSHHISISHARFRAESSSPLASNSSSVTSRSGLCSGPSFTGSWNGGWGRGGVRGRGREVVLWTWCEAGVRRK